MRHSIGIVLFNPHNKPELELLSSLRMRTQAQGGEVGFRQAMAEGGGGDHIQSVEFSVLGSVPSENHGCEYLFCHLRV